MPNELAQAQVNAPAAQPAAQDPQAAPQIPSPFADVIAGQIPAVSLPPIEGDSMDPAQKYVSENLDVLLQAGLDYVEVPHSQETILFNPKVVKEADVHKAIANGTIDKLAVPAVPAAPAQADPAAQADPTAPAAPADAPALAGASVPAPAPNRKMQAARVQNARAPAINTPNPVPNQLARRAV